MAGKIGDSELRKRLTTLGHTPGPITDSTRALYLRKLESLSKKRPANEASSPAPTPASSDLSRRASENEDDNPTIPPPSSAGEQSLVLTSGVTDPLSRCGPSLVVGNLLRRLGDPAHPANDTSLVFSDGSVLSVSRAILSSQCPRLIPFLHNLEDPFSITVVTLTGRSCSLHIRPSEYIADLKEKLSVSQAIPSNQQRLVHRNNELLDTATVADSQLEPGATIHLVLITSIEPCSPTLVLPGSIPWLSIGHLKVGLGLERLQQPGMVQITPHTTLPAHTAHILHVYDVSRDGFQVFVRLLYSGEVEYRGDLQNIIVAYVLCMYFYLSELAELCLSIIKGNLTVTIATDLLTYAESIQCQPLKDTCTAFMQSAV